MTIKKQLGKFALATIFMALFVTIFVTQHENIHSQLCKNYGGTPTTHYSITKATTECNNYDTENEGTLRALNGLTEIIGYTAIPFYMLTAMLIAVKWTE